MTPDILRVDALIREVAASEILPRFGRLATGDMSEKQPGQLVTIADTEAERKLIPLLEGVLPGSVVVGEEGVAARPGLLGAVSGEGPVWLVDPVDGTQNFAEAKPVFATMVALLVNRRAVASWIYDPIADRMASAETGSGAFLEGERLGVAPAVVLAEMKGRLTGRTAKKLKGKIGSSFYQRCAGHEYLALARGEAHFALFRRLYPWDHAPGELLVREAGGYARRLDRTAYEPSEVDATLLLAPDGRSWDALRALILEYAP